MLTALALSGAAPRPRVSLLTALPLIWGEGNAADVLAGRSARSDTLKALDAQIDVRPIDVVTDRTLGEDVAIIAQPRRLTPQELVTFDAWVRRGGRALIFADPELLWPSDYAPGDSRRAPPVTLLDPLLKHWQIALGDSDHRERTITLGGVNIALAASGAWTVPKTCHATTPEILDCRIGKGRVLLVGDADLLDPRLWQEHAADNPAWVLQQIAMLRGQTSFDSNRTNVGLIGALGVAGLIFAAFSWRYYKNRQRTSSD